jgi:predicted  nucleic acid-binding Zn-ribbon protein
MHPTDVLLRLIEIQKNDGALDALAREKQAALDELDLLQAKVKALEDQVVVEKKGLEQLAKARKTIELEIGAKETQISKYQNQLLDVKSNDQYAALQHEIEKMRAEKAKQEDKVLEALLQDDEVKKRIQNLSVQVDAEKKVLAEDRKGLEEKVTNLDLAAVAKNREREALLAKAEEEMPSDLESYEAIRSSGKKVAIARIRDGENCEGCHMSISPQILQEVRQGMQLVRCTCGRFLYMEDEA